MEPIYLDGHSLTLEQIRRVAADRVPVTLTPDAEERIVRCRGEVERIIADNEVVYGINTGFGALKDIRIPPINSGAFNVT